MFNLLQEKITQRLKAILKSNQELGVVSKLSPTQETEGLAPHEVAAIVILMEHRLSPDSKVSPHQVAERMRRAGFTEIAVGIALNSLHVKGYIDYVEDRDDFGNPFPACSLSPKGLQWIQDNQSSLVLRKKPPPSEGPEISDEDIPF
jgi:hypothetical protein